MIPATENAANRTALQSYLDLFRAVQRHVDDVISSGAVFTLVALNGEGVEIYEVINNLAAEHEPVETKKAEAALNALDELDRPDGVDAPSDAATELWTPRVDTAYLLGLAVG